MSDEQLAQRLRDGLDTPAPTVVVDPAAVVRTGRRRRAGRIAAASSAVGALVVGVTVALVVGSSGPTPVATASATALPAAQAGMTQIYANDRVVADGTVVAEGTLLATLRTADDGSTACEAAGDAVAGSEFFCDWVTKILLVDPVFGASADERRALVAAGLTVTTTLDPQIQAAAFEEVVRMVPVGDPSG
ncbi:MAG: hypothetical protein FWE61_09880, partial [Micrococcales bacterium]|nr:hypothetical protein [Micrococcales bacterium]